MCSILVSYTIGFIILDLFLLHICGMQSAKFDALLESFTRLNQIINHTKDILLKSLHFAPNLWTILVLLRLNRR